MSEEGVEGIGGSDASSDGGVAPPEALEAVSSGAAERERLAKCIGQLKKKMTRAGRDAQAEYEEELASLQQALRRLPPDEGSARAPKPSAALPYREAHDKRMNMKLEQKHVRDGSGAASARFKRGAAISEKQWARMDDKLRARAVQSGALPPYKAAKKKKREAESSK
eukprot:TRINITY_DN1534_c0_g1_i10.p1 TRINITY_DN1534_c0_g1~~TRINITY_DN1534_c0_g1_i10.p1  ORF type:complete len:167 (+),score=45.89 TRINITY_DN1534_c0_g1_i10:1431-1931(+)